jgi:hypothetical protein
MRKRLLIGICLLALFAAGVGLGMFVQYRLQIAVAEATARQVLDLARGFAGEGDPGPPAPALEDWHYPGAIEQGSIKGTSLEINGQIVKPAPIYVLWGTPDDYDKVVAFYAEKGGFKQIGGQGFEGNTRGESNVVLSDDWNPERNPDGSGKSRPIRALCLRRRCGSYDLAIFITRAQGEGHTHIVLLYERKVGGAAAQ